jgi:hypothetical protein
VADERFPVDLTSEESAFGFGVVQSPAGHDALVVSIGGGLRAVKMRAADGTTEYAVCDDRLQPIYVAAKTLNELRERFVTR